MSLYPNNWQLQRETAGAWASTPTESPTMGVDVPEERGKFFFTKHTGDLYPDLV